MIGSPVLRFGPFSVMPAKPRIQVLALLQSGQNLLDVFHGNGKTDSRIVPFDAGDFVGAFRVERHDDAHHPAADVDQRPAIVVRREGCVGLNRLAPDAIQRTEDPHRHIGPLALEGAAHGDRPLADAHFRRGAIWPTGNGFSTSTFSSTSIRE